mmetsp:Transcript_67310/g.217319  ORF Transcript_67310/g.217319 Transcript_67310/m.217319 type:complete len:397 (-) Transcript_67310:166-1356(-)
MPFMAAAAVGTARGAAGPSGRPWRSVPEEKPPCSGPNVAAAMASCACVLLASVGLVMLVNSFTDTRGALVSDYDAHVTQWVDAARASFAAVEVNATVRWVTGHRVLQRMEASEDDEPQFHDAEHGKGLLPYVPLTFASSFDFESYYPGTEDGTETTSWEPLPDRETATSVIFQFTLRSSNGTLSTFATPSLPLVYDEVVRSKTPAPDNKCRMQQNGVWRDRRCHVVKRLTQLCLQVQLDEGGAWMPNHRDTPDPPSGPSRSSTPETYGCDPMHAWNPATYTLDPCWGRRVSDRCPREARTKHVVHVIMRSAWDPFISAEELTDDTLNFGLSPSSQRVNGITMLAVGCCLGLVPVIRICKLGEDPRYNEDCRALSAHRDEQDGSGVHHAGVYGNRML